jgi:hypothetical protein
VVGMLFEVDFAVKINDSFQTIHKEFIFADSVSKCQGEAETIRNELPHNRNHHIYIFIGD